VESAPNLQKKVSLRLLVPCYELDAQQSHASVPNTKRIPPTTNTMIKKKITSNNYLKNTVATLCVATSFLACGTAQAATPYSWTNLGTDNLWQNSDNWSNGTSTGLPWGSAAATINLSGLDKVVADTTTTSTVEYIRIGTSGTGELTVDGASLETRDLDRANYIGYGSGNTGILNMSSGTFEYLDRVYIGNSSSDGTVNQTGGTLIFSESNGDTRDNSVQLGSTNGTGTYNFYAGNLEVAKGLYLYAGGTSETTFNVYGYDAASSIQIGGTDEDRDGAWTQSSGATLAVYVDGDTTQGTTLIDIRLGSGSVDETGNDNDGVAVFELGSLLYVDFNSGSQGGTWTIMSAAGGITDNGLAFAEGVDTDIWSFAIVDGEGDLDYLQVTALIPEPSAFALIMGGSALMLIARRRRR
jgi:hypothetical protein